MTVQEISDNLGKDAEYIHITSAKESDVIKVKIWGVEMHLSDKGQRVVSAIVYDRSGTRYYTRPQAIRLPETVSDTGAEQAEEKKPKRRSKKNGSETQGAVQEIDR